MKISAVILLLLQIIAHSVRLPDCTCVETFNSVEECVAAYWSISTRKAIAKSQTFMSCVIHIFLM